MVSFLYITPQYVIICDLRMLSNVTISGNVPHGMHLNPHNSSTN